MQTLRVEAPEPTFITIQHQHQMESDLAYCSDLYLTVAFFIKHKINSHPRITKFDLQTRLPSAEECLCHSLLLVAIPQQGRAGGVCRDSVWPVGYSWHPVSSLPGGLLGGASTLHTGKYAPIKTSSYSSLVILL